MEQRGKKEKRNFKKNEESSETSGTKLNSPAFKSQEDQKKKTKKKGHEKILEEIIVENFPKMGKEIATQVKKSRKSQTG